jgi:hypothetical protein
MYIQLKNSLFHLEETDKRLETVKTLTPLSMVCGELC